ncbi:hypothetical protein QUC31_007959 [Theobroma cacao]
MGEYEKMMMMNNNKGKGIAVRTRANQNYGGEDEDDGKITSPSVPSAKSSPRNASSKYDFVKVKVWLGDNADHYYVLSRFLLSRMLTVTKIPNHVAIKIALELKKLLIDNSLLDVYDSHFLLFWLLVSLFRLVVVFFLLILFFCSSQSDLEANLFKLMERRGYGEEYINRYKMMTRFHHQRVPLVILVCGTACVGKSTIATQLAQRLNLPNVLQTDMVYELLRTSTDAPLASTPVWARDFSSSEELITEFCRECRIVRKGLNGDLKKAMKDGKPIIIEGIHLDPSIYLMEDEHKIPISVPEGHQAAPLSKASNDNSAVQMENNSTSTFGSHTEDSQNCPVHLSLDECVSADQVNKVSEYLESIALSTASDDKGETVKVPEVNGTTARKEKSGSEPIIIPIILNMAEFDHKALLEEWILTRTFSGNCPVKDTDSLIANLKTIQDYLCSFKSQGLTVVNVSATTFPQTLDWLHGYLLQIKLFCWLEISATGFVLFSHCCFMWLVLSGWRLQLCALSKAFHQCPMKMVGGQRKNRLHAVFSLSNHRTIHSSYFSWDEMDAESNSKDIRLLNLDDPISEIKLKQDSCKYWPGMSWVMEFWKTFVFQIRTFCRRANSQTSSSCKVCTILILHNLGDELIQNLELVGS